MYYPASAIIANPTLRRNHSYIDLHDLTTKQHKKFTFSKQLGDGTYGYVRLFVNGDEKIAVKAPKDGREVRHLTQEKLDKAIAVAKNELEMLRKAYPDEPYYSLEHYDRPEDDKDGLQYNYRMTIPFVPGSKLSTYF